MEPFTLNHHLISSQMKPSLIIQDLYLRTTGHLPTSNLQITTKLKTLNIKTTHLCREIRQDPLHTLSTPL